MFKQIEIDKFFRPNLIGLGFVIEWPKFIEIWFFRYSITIYFTKGC